MKKHVCWHDVRIFKIHVPIAHSIFATEGFFWFSCFPARIEDRGSGVTRLIRRIWGLAFGLLSLIPLLGFFFSQITSILWHKLLIPIFFLLYKGIMWILFGLNGQCLMVNWLLHIEKKTKKAYGILIFIPLWYPTKKL